MRPGTLKDFKKELAGGRFDEETLLNPLIPFKAGKNMKVQIKVGNQVINFTPDFDVLMAFQLFNSVDDVDKKVKMLKDLLSKKVDKPGALTNPAVLIAVMNALAKAIERATEKYKDVEYEVKEPSGFAPYRVILKEGDKVLGEIVVDAELLMAFQSLTNASNLTSFKNLVRRKVKGINLDDLGMALKVFEAIGVALDKITKASEAIEIAFEPPLKGGAS